MKKIFKYSIEIEDVQTIKLPINAEILTVQCLNEIRFLYAAIDPNNLSYTEDTNIYIFGTGHPIPNYADLIFLNTIQQRGGILVWHIFKEKK